MVYILFCQQRMLLCILELTEIGVIVFCHNFYDAHISTVNVMRTGCKEYTIKYLYT